MIPECLKEYDYRGNIIVDKDNPILVWKAWRDHFTNGKAFLASPNGEDALTWNVFRSFQKAGNAGLDIISEVFGISKEVKTILFWGCDAENHGEEQQLLNILIRTIDGQLQGTMTEPDLVIITEDEVVFVECKLNLSGTTSPWKASSKKKNVEEKDKIDGADKRFAIYKKMFPELMCINDWRDVYQLIRQYVYAKKLADYLNKKPLVIPLINADHKCNLSRHYSKIKDCIANYNAVLQNFVTWQDIKEKISGSNLPNKEDVLRKIKDALSNAR